MKTRKFLCLFVLALAVFGLSGCGGSSHNSFVDDEYVPETTSPDVTTPTTPTTPTSTDTTPTAPFAPPDDLPTTSIDVTPAPAPGSADVPIEIPTPPSSGDQSVTPPTPPTPASGDNSPAPASPDVQPVSQDTTTTISTDQSGQTFTSTTALTNALVLSSGTATYSNITVTKTGDASGQSENYDWYGTNAAVLAKGGAKLTISGSGTTISSNAVGGNAVFAYGGNSGMNTNNSGDGSTITISDATITTQSNNSGGIMVTGGGVIEASNLTITTSGGSSAAIRSDRGGGTITATGGTYTTNGRGSPAIYSTAAITGNDVTLKSNVAQVVVIEGGNSVTLDEATLTANHSELNGQDTTHQAVLIYQSQSGDASNGSSSFTMEVGSLTNTLGDVFHVTNTTTTINLKGVAITNNDSSGCFLRASSDSWGKSGNNGGKVTLNADSQTINGDMIVDSVSTLTLNLSNSAVFNGAINSSSQAGNVSVTLDSTSKWTLTGNTYITSLTNNGGTIDKGSYNLYVNGTAQ